MSHQNLYLINQADVWDGKQRKENGGDNQRPEKVSIHPKRMITARPSSQEWLIGLKHSVFDG